MFSNTIEQSKTAFHRASTVPVPTEMEATIQNLSQTQFQYLSKAREVLRESNTLNETIIRKDDCCGSSSEKTQPGVNTEVHFCKDTQMASCVKKSGWMQRRSKILIAGYADRETLNIADLARVRQLEIKIKK